MLKKELLSTKKELDDSLKPYGLKQLDGELKKVKSAALESGFNYDNEIAIAEIDVVQATEYSDRFNYYGLFIVLFSTFLLTFDFARAFPQNISFGAVFFVTAVISLIYRARLAEKICNAKQRILILRLSKELKQP